LATERVTVGTAIAYAFGRTPLVLAAEARDLDALSHGRLILGLGTGTQRMQREWHGLDGEHPPPRMEELVPLIRALLRLHEGPLEHEGRFYRTVVRPTAPIEPPLRTDLPIYMGGVNPRMIEAAGAVADGLVGHPLFTPEYTRQGVRPALARGAERAGRPDPPPIAGYLTCFVNEDGAVARAAARGVIAFNSTVSTYRPVLAHHGSEANAEEIRAAWTRGDGAGMAAAVSDEMIATIAVAGTPRRSGSQLRGPPVCSNTRCSGHRSVGSMQSARRSPRSAMLPRLRMTELEQLVLSEQRGDVVVLTLNRPAKRNALSLALRDRLADALEACAGPETGADPAHGRRQRLLRRDGRHAVRWRRGGSGAGLSRRALACSRRSRAARRRP
jgi:alkanesulfonate monooxygenase SsuD/methylene tetrahydromethanopterin reductase-like flavin-dependent oxidoreductase (luciferase family)